MRRSCGIAAAAAATAQASSLADVCTVANVQSSLPTSLAGIDIDFSSVTAAAVYNYTSTSYGASTSETYTFCNVTVSYAHTGKDDTVQLWFFLPSPSAFLNRYLETGGGAYAISSGESSLTYGLPYGAVTGTTDGGWGWANSLDSDGVFLAGNGSYNYDPVYMFGYKAHGESTTVGKALTQNFYGNATSKPYTYFEGCSDGGRQAMSQVQRWGDLYDGIVAGAPAFRYGQQQVNHLFSNVVEKTMDYYPPPCEMEKILNLTLAACDPMDGKTDGVVARSDLCKLNYDLSSAIGESYYCAGENSTSIGLGYGTKHKRQYSTGSTTYQPAQNGTVTAEGVAVAKAIYEGLFNSKGERAYLSYQTAAAFDDAETAYDDTTDSWGLSITGSSEWVWRFLELSSVDTLTSIDNVTYDTMVEWMDLGFMRYYDSLQTTVPDLTTFQSNGGKLLHYHGESDASVPTASSVHYWNSVRNIMYPDASFDDSVSDLAEWYRLFLVSGAAHCAVVSTRPIIPLQVTSSY